MTGVAVSRKDRGDQIASMITGDWATQIAGTAYRGFTPDRMAAELMQAAAKEPKLLQCTPASIFLAVTKIARWGLAVGDGAYLVAVSNSVKDAQGNKKWIQVAEAWPDYRGLKALAMRQNLVRMMEEHVVYEGDDFEYRLGMDPYLHHKPCREDARGELLGAYSIITLRFGVRTFHYMPVAEIERIRSGSRWWGPTKFPACPPWYAKKTVVRDWLNRQPKNGAMADALESGDLEERAVVIDHETGEILTGPAPAQISAPTPEPDDAELDRLAAIESGDLEDDA